MVAAEDVLPYTSEPLSISSHFEAKLPIKLLALGILVQYLCDLTILAVGYGGSSLLPVSSA